MKNTIALALTLASFSAAAQDTLITELESGDKWFRGSFASASQDKDFKLQSTGDKFSKTADADLTDISFITALSGNNDFTPGLGFSISQVNSDGEASTLYDVSAGGLFKTENAETFAVFGTYSSSDDDDRRDSFQLNVNVQTSAITSSLYNEISISTEYQLEKDGTSGGHSVDISNQAKFRINSKLDFVSYVGLELQTDTDMSDNVVVSSDPQFTFGAQLNINIIESMTIEIEAAKSFASGVVDYDGEKVDVDVDTTITLISLIARI